MQSSPSCDGSGKTTFNGCKDTFDSHKVPNFCSKGFRKINKIWEDFNCGYHANNYLDEDSYEYLLGKNMKYLNNNNYFVHFKPWNSFFSFAFYDSIIFKVSPQMIEDRYWPDTRNPNKSFERVDFQLVNTLSKLITMP